MRSMVLNPRLLFDHQIGFEMDLPVQDDADVEERIFRDLEVGGESVFVPPENNARGNGFNIHRGGLDDAAVACGVFDDFLVEHFILAPAGNGVELIEAVGVGRDVEITLHELGVVTILRARLKILADHELEKLDLIVRHAVILIKLSFDCKKGTDTRGACGAVKAHERF